MQVSVITNYLAELGRFSEFTGKTLYWITKPPFFGNETLKSMKNLLVQCSFPVISIVCPTGMVIALQSMIVIDMFGTQRLLSSLLAEEMLRDLSPTLSGVMIAAQAGSSYAGEIGTMRVKEEIDALETMSVNPFQYIVLPRILSIGFICPILNIIGGIFGIFGGYFVAVYLKGLNQGVFFDNLFTLLKVSHVWEGILKAFLFGIIVGLISCYKGYNVTGGSVGVGKAANSTVVQSVLMIIIVNYFVSLAIINLGI